MNWFEKIQRYYKGGYYSNAQVRLFVQVNKISEEQFYIITGEQY